MQRDLAKKFGLGSLEFKKEFPILLQQVNGKPLIYFDNAATTQKPLSVIEAITKYYIKDNANVHRGLHALSERATEQYENVRKKVQTFIKAKEAKEIVFCRGTTEAINLVAHSYVEPRLNAEDEIIISEMEHHSNIVPWQMIAKRTGAIIRVIPMNESGELELNNIESLFTPKTKFLSLAHVSNALGVINPVRKLIKTAHSFQVPVLIDGAQAVSHQSVDVGELDCDFYAFSAHKMYGPTGIGVLYGKANLLEEMTPYQGGGEMIQSVTFDSADYNVIPYKFEAGTPSIASAIGLGAAIDFLQEIGMECIRDYENKLFNYLLNEVQQIKGIKILSSSSNKTSIVTFVMDKVHAHDIGTILNNLGIAIRSGHHCAMPIMKHFNVAASARASLGIYNDRQEIDSFIQGIHQVKKVFGL